MSDTNDDTGAVFDATGLTSILDTVNAMIGTLGEDPVDSLDAPNSDVRLAMNVLRIRNLAIQSKGWSWNRLYAYQLSPSPDQTIAVPEGTIEVSKAYLSPGTFPYTPSAAALPFVADGIIRVSLRGGKLWDKYNNTNLFSAPIYCDLIVAASWEDVPEAFRQWIAYSACQRFHAQLQEREILLRVNDQDLQDAMLTAMQREDEAERYNTVSGNIGTVTKIYGYGGLRRNRGGLSS